MTDTSSESLDGWLSATTLKFASGFRHAVGLGRTCPLHAHRTIELVYHPTGRGHTCLAGGLRREFAEGDVIVYAPGTAHDQAMTRAGEDWCVHLSTSDRWPAQGGVCLCVATTETMRSDLAALSGATAPEGHAVRRALDARGTALLIDLLQRREADARAHNWTTYASRAREMVLRESTSVPDIASLAAALDVSGDYLRHLFRAEYGESLGQFLIKTRLHRARAMLQFSRVPLKTIVAACGFANDRYFCTTFRRRFGCTPTEFRRRNIPGSLASLRQTNRLRLPR